MDNEQVFDSNGTFDVPAGVTEIVVEAWGAGGGGGGGKRQTSPVVTSEGGGGGGGGYSRATLTVTPETSHSVVRGTGGAGNSGAAGGAGGDSTFGSGPLVRAKGGAGGSFADTNAAGGAGGLASGGIGDVKTDGGDGGLGDASGSGNGGGGGGSGGAGGAGGDGGQGSGSVGSAGAAGAADSPWAGGAAGGEGGAQSPAPTQGGTPGGGGGGGGSSGTSDFTQAGAAGRNGRVIVHWDDPFIAVTSLDPADNATEVNPDIGLLVVTFDGTPIPGSGDVRVVETGVGTHETIAIGSCTVDGNDLEIPIGALDSATAYHVEIDATALANFVGIADSTTWNFTTGIQVATLTPADNAAGVLPGIGELVVVFDDDWTAGSGDVRVVETGVGTHETIAIGSCTGAGTTTLTIPIGDLEFGTAYHIEIDAAAVTEYGGIDDETTWNFATAVEVTILTVSPADGVSGIAPSIGSLVVTFTGVANSASGDIRVVETGVGTHETIAVGSVTGDGTDTITIPIGDLDPGTAYHIEIDAGAFVEFAGIDDATTWNFTTAGADDIPMPYATLEIAPGDVWNEANPTWVEITDDLREPWSISMGRDISDTRARPSTLNLTLDNSSRDYDPENAAGPYFGDLVPLMQIRLRLTHNSVTYERFRGFVLAWPNSIIDHGKAVVNLIAYDGFTQLQRRVLRSVWEQEAQALSPRAWWRLAETAGTTAVDASGNGHHGTYEGSPSLAAVASPVVLSGLSHPDFDGSDDRVSLPPAATIRGNSPWSIAAWLKAPTGEGAYGYYQEHGLTGATANTVQLRISSATGQIYGFTLGVKTAAGQPGTGGLLVTAGTYDDGEWHHAVMTYDGAVGWALYVDGAEADTYTDPIGPLVLPPSDSVAYIGFHNPLYGVGDLGEVLIFDSELTPANVSDLYDAATQSWDSQLTSLRIGGLLDAIGWPAALRSLDVGVSTMGPATTAGASAREAVLSAVETEDGQAWIDGGGRFVFKNRRARSISTPADTYSDDGADIKIYDWETVRDDLALFTVAQVTNADGQLIEVAADSEPQYGPRVISRNSFSASVSEPADYARWLASRFGISRTRLERLVARAFPDSSNARWAAMLSRDLGDLLNVEVNPKGGGDPIDEDWFVEQITLTGMAGMYEMSMQLSPADGQRAWVLDDAVLSVLGDTTVLGW